MIELAANIQQTVLGFLPGRRKKSGQWTTFNAVCCSHMGESADTRSRGGIICNPAGSISYHCFNCGFKAGFYPGRALGFRFRKLLRWMGADDNTIQLLVMEALRLREIMPPLEEESAPDLEVSYKPRPLPADSASLQEWATVIRLMDDSAQLDSQLKTAVSYVYDRAIDLQRYDFYVSTDKAYNMHKRVIIPYYWKKELIGYTARAVDDTVKPKYHNSHDSGFVFNTDQQNPDAKFVIVTEGPFDAMAVDGVSVLHNEVSDTQADIIESLGREVIVVPDWDEAGKKLIEAALDFGWSVSFPVWREKHKDVNSAVIEYGKLFVLKSILAGKESNPIKIQLRQRL